MKLTLLPCPFPDACRSDTKKNVRTFGNQTNARSLNMKLSSMYYAAKAEPIKKVAAKATIA